MKKYSGYTLIELMVIMVIIGIIATQALPQMKIFFSGSAMVANTNDLLAGLHIARSEAVKKSQRVSICRSANADSAAPLCSTNGDDWSKGWFVYEETTGSTIGKYESGVDGDILRVNAGAEGDKVTVTASNINMDKFVSFTSRGVPKLTNGSGQSGLFRICDERGLLNDAGHVVARGIVLGASGRVRVTKDKTKLGSCP